MNFVPTTAPDTREQPSTGWMSVRQAALAFAAVVLVIAATFGYLRLAGWSAYTLQGHSMEPTIAPGSLVIARMVPTNSLAVGDIAVFEVGWLGRDAQVTAAHRIERIERSATKTSIFTKGDNNAVPDPEATVLGDTAIRAAFTIKHGAAMLRYAQFLGLIAVAVMLYTKMAGKLAPIHARPQTAQAT